MCFRGHSLLPSIRSGRRAALGQAKAGLLNLACEKGGDKPRKAARVRD